MKAISCNFCFLFLVLLLSASSLIAGEFTPVNLVQDPDFSQRDAQSGNLRFWIQQIRTAPGATAPDVTFAIVKADDGENNAARIAVPPPGVPGKSVALYLQLIPVKPNTRYYVSCRRRIWACWAPVYIDFRNKNRQYVSSTGLTQVEHNGDGNYDLCETSFTTGPDIHYSQIMLTLQNLGAGEAEFTQIEYFELPEL